ncbi:nitrate/nitrite transporter [Chloroflexota bacterium]
MINNPQSKYRWYILTLATATNLFVVTMSSICMAVLFKEISDELDLNLVQIGTIWGMTGLAGLFTTFIAGLAGDRFGAKRTLGVACILVGITGAMRGFSGSFTDLATTMFLLGLFSPFVPLNTHKTAAEWFSGPHLGVANGILAAGMGVGFTLGSMISATVLSPALGGWRNVVFVYGAVAIVIGFLWFLARSEPGRAESNKSSGRVPFRQALSRVIHIRNVWFLALTHMCFNGATLGLQGYLSLYLRGKDWAAAGADGALAAFSAAGTAGVVPLSLLSDRLGSRKVIALAAILITTVGIGLLSVFGGAMVWPLVISVGLVSELMRATLVTMIMETEGIGPAYAGTALGITLSCSRLGTFFSPPLGNSLANINPSSPFIFWSALAGAALLTFNFVKETGWRKRR